MQNAVPGCDLKNDRMTSVPFQGKSFNITVIQFYVPNTNAEEAEGKRFYEDLKYFLKLTPKKDVCFIIGNWKAKVGSQEIVGIMGKFSLGVQNEAVKLNKVLSREHIGYSIHTFPTTQKTTVHIDITKWSISKSD